MNVQNFIHSTEANDIISVRKTTIWKRENFSSKAKNVLENWFLDGNQWEKKVEPFNWRHKKFVNPDKNSFDQLRIDVLTIQRTNEKISLD